MVSHEQPVLYSVDLEGCAAIRQLSADEMAEAFTRSLEGAGATVVESVAHRFPGAGGLTCVLILAESHAVLHTWPETGMVNIDIFSCTSKLQSRAAIAQLGRTFGAARISVHETPRADGHLPPSDQRP